MAISELSIEAFIKSLLEKLASGDFITLVRSTQLSSQLHKLTETLTEIRSLLVDTRQKHIRDRSVQLWLNKLHHLAYEIDDILDDFATEATRHKLNQESHATSTSKNTSKVLNFIPNKFQLLKYGLKMKFKLIGITTKLNDLVEEKEQELLGLKCLNENVVSSVREVRLLGETETSVAVEFKVIGRDGDKEALLKKLLGDDESSSSQTENVSTVSIVGPGGIGKTTLARLLYDDERVKRHFGLMAWVCVSGEFDVFNISAAIFQAVSGGYHYSTNLNDLQKTLSEKLSNKRFLVVLDGLQNESHNEWECLQRCFLVGAPGSKVLMTTRKTMVASAMDSVDTYPLELLPYEEALSLFSHHASYKQKFDVNCMLKLHGEDIVQKCGRLPLALTTVGRVFRTKVNEGEWEELLNSEIWSLGNENEILPALRLSYYELQPHLKQMFIYCCLFPKDYEFDKDEIVHLWMAEGYLYESDNMSMENFGRQCFEELVSRSFFQHSTNDKSRYRMHDLINVMATSVAGEFFFVVEDKMDVHCRHEELEKVHHLSFIHEEYGTFKKFKALQRARYMRTFLAMSVIKLHFWKKLNAPDNFLVELLPQLQLLRVLSLVNYNITEVPRSIGTLKHIRYINFSNTGITCLPEQVGNLLNLQCLLLSGCSSLSSLPNSIGKLIKLRHLDLRNTVMLDRLPLGISGLTGLQTLSRVIIGEADDDFKISDLKGLLHLQGQLSIEGLHKVKNATDAKEANLQQKKGISDLRMEWSYILDASMDDSRNAAIEQEVLEWLRPFKQLRSLSITYYVGREFPSWVGDPSYVCLTELTLYWCNGCECLPTLGHLPSLQKLCAVGIHRLKRLGSEFLRPCNSYHGVAFPSLEVLEFRDMREWEEWSMGGGGIGGTFPCLREMSISYCPNLAVVALDSIPSLRDLYVAGCSLTVLRSLVGVSSSIARLSVKNIRGLTRLHGGDLEHMKAVEHLKISECYDLTHLWESEAEAYEILVSLQKLEIHKCENLISLGEKEVRLKSSIKSVREVVIRDCLGLKRYDCPNGIENLAINGFTSVTSLGFPTTDGLPSTLKKLAISVSGDMEVSWLPNSFLSSLESLSLWNTPRLFPEGCLVHLTRLQIYRCDNLESIPDDGYGFLPFHCLRYLGISYSKNLKSFPHKHLPSLTSLEEMTIYGCPNLDDSFPCGSWPPNLTSLDIGGLKKPISEWGLQNFPTSLVTLVLHGHNSGVVSFATAKAEEDTISSSSTSFLLPSSLTSLIIWGFNELDSLSGGMQHLTRLQHLKISACPKLRDLPETLFPSLSSLTVDHPSPKLKKKCRRRKGKYWPIISQIPELTVTLSGGPLYMHF